MTDVFISYSTKDSTLAQDICAYLELNKLSCWIAPRNITPGTEYAAEIITGIEASKIFLLIFSEHSNQSQHVLREVGRAVHRNIPIIAYCVSNVNPTKSMEYFLESVQWLNASTHNTNHPEVLLAAIHNLLNPQVTSMLSPTVSTSPLKHTLFSKKNIYPMIIGAMFTIIIGLFFILLQNKNNQEAVLASKDALTTYPAIIETAPKSTNVISTNPDTSLSTSIPTTEILDHSSTDNNSSQVSTSPENTLSDSPATVSPAQDITHSPSSDTSNTSASVLAIGDYLQFGTYYPIGYSDSNNDSKLNWIVLDKDESTGKVLCITSNIIDIKFYDGAESGERTYDRAGNRFLEANRTNYSPTTMTEFFGNSDWSTSNIRTWLNSDQAKVSYKDQAPTNDASELYENQYDKQAGFLYHFTSNEKSLLVTRKNSTASNALGSGNKVTEDKVFLLSQDEVQKYLINQNLSIYATPTLSACNSDKTEVYKYNKEQGSPNHRWVLRTPAKNVSEQIMVVGDGHYDEQDFFYVNAASPILGIRPAIVIDTHDLQLSGDGTISSPYVLK